MCDSKWSSGGSRVCSAFASELRLSELGITAAHKVHPAGQTVPQPDSAIVSNDSASAALSTSITLVPAASTLPTILHSPAAQAV